MLRSFHTIPTIAVSEALQSHERQQQHRQHQLKSLDHHQQNELQRQQIVEWKNTGKPQGSVKVYAPEVIAALQADEEAKTQLDGADTSEALLTPSSASALGSPRNRTVKKFGHARTASMVELLLKEVQSASASQSRNLQDTMSRNSLLSIQQIRSEYSEIQRHNQSFVRDIKSYLLLEQEQKLKYRKSLYQRWQNLVFEPIQASLVHHVNSNTKELRRFSLALFEHYLHEPTTSVAFPSTCLRQLGQRLPSPPTSDVSTYHNDDMSKINRDDPTFHTLTLQQQQQSQPPSSSQSLPVANHQSKSMFAAQMWDKLVATPFGRYNVDPDKSSLSLEHLTAIEQGVRRRMSAMGFDAYDFPTDHAVSYEQHFGSKGKRIVRPIQSTAYNVISNEQIEEK